MDETLKRAMEQHIYPRVTAMVENITLQKTNSWGEAKGTPLTFVEYLVERTDQWIREEVNYEGKVKGEDSFSWNKKGTRIQFMIDKYLQYSISTAMEQALGLGVSSVRKGLEDAVKIAIDNIKVTVKTEVKT